MEEAPSTVSRSFGGLPRRRRLASVLDHLDIDMAWARDDAPPSSHSLSLAQATPHESIARWTYTSLSLERYRPINQSMKLNTTIISNLFSRHNPTIPPFSSLLILYHHLFLSLLFCFACFARRVMGAIFPPFIDRFRSMFNPLFYIHSCHIFIHSIVH